MGLLDTKAMKFLFGDSAYMKNQRKVERAGDFSSLLGQPAGSQGQGPRIAQGLLGGQTTPEQFALQAATIPGYESFGGTMYNNIQDNDAAYNRQALSGFDAMNRQQQGQDFSMNNLTADQFRQQNNSDRSFYQNQENTDRAFFQGQENTDRAYLTEQVKQSGQNLEIGNQLLGSLPKVGGSNVIDYGSMNATQDNQMLMAFAKVINPGEAVGVDEKGAIQGASWMPDFLMQGIAALESGGQMPATLRQQIFAQYTKALQSNQNKINLLRQMNSGASGSVYSPEPQDYQGMYTGGQVPNNNLFNGDTSGRTKLPVVTDQSLIKRLFGD